MNSFINDPVDIASLPQAKQVELQPVEAAYRKVVQWEWMIGWGIILLAAIVTIGFIPSIQTFFGIAIIAGSIFFLSFLNLWLALKSFSMKAYAIRDKDLLYRSGWIIHRFSVCPFDRIQHCSVNAGPFERKLGLASLSVFTAGTEGADIKIPGLLATTAFALRDFIMKKTGNNEQPGN